MTGTRAAADALARLRETADDGTAAGLPFVDARENGTDPADPRISADQLQPGDAGHRRPAEALVPFMQAALDG